MDYKDRLVKEYVDYPENITKEVKDNIIKGLVDWVNTGTYSYEHADKINITSDLQEERQQFRENEQKRNIALEQAYPQGDKSMPIIIKMIFVRKENKIEN